MAAVLGAFSIGKVWDSGYVHGSRIQQKFYSTIKAKNIRFGKPRAGFSETMGQAKIDVLAPGKALLSGTESDANNNSLVMRISYGKTSFLLTGDMEGEERATVPRWPTTTVLKVAHHGSRNGTDLTLARAVSPSVAVVSCGAGNSYGHPHQEALQALQAVGAKVLRTDQVGTVVLTTDGKKLSCTTLSKAVAHARLTPTLQQQSAASNQTAYIGNRNSHVFHLPSCSSLPAEKNRVYFDSREAAIEAGYRPCKRCNP